MGKKFLEKLSPEQGALLPVLRDEWLRIGLSTERMDKDATIDAVNLAYIAGGLPIPRHIVFTDSPWSGMLLANLATQGKLRLDFDDEVGSQVYSQVASQVRSQVHSQVDSQVDSQVYSQVYSQVASQVDSQVYSQVASLDGFAYVVPASWGSHGSWWASYYGTFNHLGLPGMVPVLGHIWMSMNAGWFWSLDGLAIVCDRPCVLERDERHNLHSLAGPAIAYTDGFAVYAVHGVRVPQHVIENPDDITAEMVRKEDNAEVRRVMIEQMGADKYLRESSAQLIHEDVDELGFGRKLWKCPIPDDEDLVMVEVVNSTPEPDGEHKSYFLRVPPGTERAVQGLAWMAQVPEEDYVLAVQT